MESDYIKDKPWSFGNPSRVRDHNPGLKNNQIKNFLAKNEIYTRFREHKKNEELFTNLCVQEKGAFSG